MGRDEIQSAQSRPGFPEYGETELDKVNTMRSDKTQPDFMGIPIIQDGWVMLCSAEAIGNKPASCYTCIFHDGKERCGLLDAAVVVSKVIGDKEYDNPIEYWPCCSMHNYGEPSGGACEPTKTPDAIGLIWINSSKPGQDYGGANCAGTNGGDDCDNYQVEKGEKWDSESGFCRVLQHTVQAGQVCSAWSDDDILKWEDAQTLLNGDGKRDKEKLARDILKRG
jgi:hypothetical protein